MATRFSFQLRILFGIILLFMASAAFAAKPDGTNTGVKPANTLPACSTITASNQLCGTITGLLTVVSGPDPLDLNGSTLTAITGNTNIDQNAFTSGWSVLNTPDNPGASANYTVPLSLTTNKAALSLACGTGASVNLVASASGDAIDVTQCNVTIAGTTTSVSATLTATVNFAGGTLPQALPIPFASVAIGSGSTATYTCNNTALCTTGLGEPTVLTITDGSVGAVCEHCTTMGLVPAIGTGLSFSMAQGGSVPAPKSIQVEDSPVVNVSYSAVPLSSATWLATSAPGGIINGSDTSFNAVITSAASSLTQGTYTGSITVYGPASNNPLVEPVTLTITAPSVTLVPSPPSMTFNSVNGSTPASQSLSVDTSPSGAQVPFTAAPTPSGSWLSVNPTSGTTNSTAVTVSVTPSQGAAGSINTGSIALSSADAPSGASVSITLNETTIPTPAQLSFSTTPGTNPASQSLTVTATGPNVNYAVAASSTGSWLSVSSGTFTTNSSTKPTVSVVVGSLTSGTYNGSLIITPQYGSTITVPVVLTIAATLGTNAPNPVALSYTVNSNTAPTQVVSVTSNGGAIAYTASASSTPAWLTVSPASGTASSSTPGSETISINTSVANTLTPSGTPYTGTVTFTCNPTSQCTNTNGMVTVNVALTVSAPPALQAPSSLPTFNYQYQSVNQPPNQQFTVSSSGAAINFTAAASTSSGGTWLSVTPGSGTTSAQLTASVTTGTLTAGTYNGTITLTCNPTTSCSNTSGMVTVGVTLVITSQPIFTGLPPSLSFTYVLGGSVPGSQSSSITSSATVNSVTAVPSATWLNASLSGTSTGPTSPVTLTVSLVQANLPTTAGSYPATIAINGTAAAGGAATQLLFPVTLTVNPQPTLSVSPGTLTFTGTVDEPNPAAQPITVTATNGTIAFTAATSASWLSVTPTSGSTSTSTSLSVSVNTGNLSPGPYTGTVTVTSTTNGVAGSPATVNVSFTVNPAPQVTANPTSLAFTYYVNGSTPAAKSVAIAASTATESYTTSATSTGNWLAVSPASGTTPGSINVSLQNLSGLTPSATPYQGSVTVTVSGTNFVTIPVSLTVSSEPSITATPNSLTFNYVAGATAPNGQSVAISTSNSAAASITATSSATWLKGTLSSGTTPTSLLVTIVTTGLTANTYNGTVTIASNGYVSATVNVMLVVTQPTAVIQVSGTTYFTLANSSGPSVTTLSVSSSDGSAQPFTISVATEQYNWITISPISGTTPANLTVTVSASGLPPGVYITPVTVNMPNLPIPMKVIQAQLTVTGANIMASPSMLTFNYQPAAAFPAVQTIALTTPTGVAPVPIASVSTIPSWVIASISSNTTPATITVSVNPGLLTVGTYYGSVYVKASGSPIPSLSIPVILTVSAAPTISVSPTSLSFTYQIGTTLSAAQSFAVSSSSSVPVSFTVTPPAWLTVSPTSGTTPASVMVTPNTTGLGPGTYTGMIAVIGSGVGTVNVAVTLTVTGSAQLTVSPTSLAFVAPTGAAPPSSQSLMITSGGPAISFTAASGSTWLSVTPTSGTTPATLTVSVNTTGLTPGFYIGAISITGSGSGVTNFATVGVTLGIGNTPTITGIINAASGATGEIAPGMAVSIFGTSLGPATPATGVTFTNPPTGETIATTLAGTQVTFDGTPVPILFTIAGQVNVLAPFTFTNNTQTVIGVSYNGVPSATMTVPVVAAEPGLFTANASGKGQGAILNQDYSVNSSTNPAAFGSAIMLFGTGCGTTVPETPLGGYNPIPPPLGALTQTNVTAEIGNVSATVDYAGPAPGLVSGICQINLTVPNLTLPLPSSGAVGVTVTIGTATSQGSVTVAVQ